MEYIIYCDESDRKGKFYGNFYGGALVRSSDLDIVRSALESEKGELDLSEVKWNNVTPHYLEKYQEIMGLFFRFIKEDLVKVRIMFTQQCYQPIGLTREQKEQSYFLLYYQFLKHAFGLQYSNPTSHPIRLKLYFDQFPDTAEKANRFKNHIYQLQFQEAFCNANLIIRPEDIAEVVSHDHIILQCMDVILGSITFRLNDKHKVKPPGSWRRGTKTIAKDRLYRFMYKQIQSIYPKFNIGISTGHKGDLANRWHHPYRHWLFVPTNHEFVPQSKH